MNNELKISLTKKFLDIKIETKKSIQTPPDAFLTNQLKPTL